MSWKNTRTDSRDVDQRLEDVGEERSWLGVRARAGRGAEEALRLDRVEAAVAPRVAAQQPPRGEHQPAQYAELPDRLRRRRASRSARTAAPRQRRRDHALVERDRRAARSRARERLTRRAPPSSSSSASARADPRQALALGELARVRARHDHDVVAGRERVAARRRTPRAAGA